MLRTRMRAAVSLLAVSAVMFLVSTQVASQEKPANTDPGADAMAEMMAKWREINAKGPEHERFKESVGQWETQTLSWVAPDTKPMVSNGTAEFRLILDGRYLEQVFQGECMGEPFIGRGIEAYDRIKKKYISIWMDNMSTSVLVLEGTADESGRVITCLGKADDPLTGQKDKVVKSVARQIDKDKLIFEMYDRLPDGPEYKCMEITYTRKK